MTFNDFIPLIHAGVTGSFYLVESEEGYCIKCKDRCDLIAKLKERGMLSELSYEVVGIHPFSENGIIIEFIKRW